MATATTAGSRQAASDHAHDASELLRTARVRRNLSQRGLARAAGVSSTVVARIESGRTQPTLPTLAKLLSAAGFEASIGLVNSRKPSELLRQYKAHLLDLAERHRVRSIRVFGSVATGTDRPDSDLDLLVEFDQEVGGLERIDFAEEVQELLGVEVDMVNPVSASRAFLDAIDGQLRALETF